MAGRLETATGGVAAVDPASPERARRCVESLLEEVEALKDELGEAAGHLGAGRIQGEPDLEEVKVAIAGVSGGISEVRKTLGTYYDGPNEREA